MSSLTQEDIIYIDGIPHVKLTTTYIPLADIYPEEEWLSRGILPPDGLPPIVLQNFEALKARAALEAEEDYVGQTNTQYEVK